jgi:pyruvate-formate lyase-activating enzyme
MSELVNFSAIETTLTPVQPGQSQDKGDMFGFHELMGFCITASCPLRCQHCMFGSLLERRDIPQQADLCDWLEQAAQTGYLRLISLTGGEPFYAFEKLKALVARGATLNLRINTVTNAYWAVSKEAAQALLSQLTGLTDLYISTDEFHARDIPLDYVLNASHVAHEMGLRVSLSVSYCRIEDYWDFRSQLERRLEIPIPIVPLQIVRQGNAERLGLERFDLTEYIPRGRCRGINVPMVDKNGVVHACCEPPLNAKVAHNPLKLGDLHHEPLSTILARVEQSPYIQALRVWGPGYIAQLAIKGGLKHRLSRAYPRDSICEVCYDLLKDEEVLAVVNKKLEQPQIQREIAVRRLLLSRGR